MHKKTLKAILSVILAVAMCFVTCTAAFAASSNKNSYVKEVFLSYGKTDTDAKSYLKDNGYEVLDYNLNEGADDAISTKRAVYLGYKTTSNADEAITDMKLMNMKGGYSVEDYQILLEEQKANIKSFINNFIVAVNEYRNNYNDKKGRAVTAHDLLNLIYEDDTQQYMGDLLLNKIKEEYSDKEWNALSSDEQSKIADMTTILMQGNSDLVLVIEQVIALAADEGNEVWMNRYENAETYDEMVENLVESKGVTASEAAKEISAEYDEDAKIIASKVEDYKEFLENYTNSSVNFSSTKEEIKAFKKANDDFDYTFWYAAGVQYEILSVLENDDISLLDLITSDEYDIENDDRYMLYPFVSVLSKGQRACLEFLSIYQIVSFGINGDEASKEAINKINLDSLKEKNTSLYEGVDRSIFTDDVALTNEALRLQNSTGKNAMQSMSDYISTTSAIFYAVFGVSAVATATSFAISGGFKLAANKYDDLSRTLLAYSQDITFEPTDNYDEVLLESERAKAEQQIAAKSYRTSTYWSKVFYYAGIAMACVTIVLMVASLCSTYSDLKEYYNTDFTPIPKYMVSQTTNENDEKVYTYYNAVKCNRKEKNMISDSTKLLKDYGDLNGDVGREWVALYTTTDKSAGDPIKTDFVVQYSDSNIPNDTIALSMFGESVAQNLTNKKSGYTYSDDKNGIYLFYGTDTTAFAGSVFSSENYIALGVAAALVCCIGAFFVGKKTEKKKYSTEMKANA